MSEPERYFFCHLQKTGGTSLQMALRKQYGPRAVYPLPEHRKDVRSQMDVDFLRDVFEREGDRIRIVTGHFPLCTTELLGVPFRTFAVLREPLDRTLSFLRHQARLDPRWTDVPLPEAYGHPPILHALIHNHMVKMLGLTVAEMDRGVATMTQFDEGHLERACAALDAMDVVGIQQDMAGFYRRLEERFGWSLGTELRANATEPSAPIDEVFEARILRDNALDVRLYEYTVDLVARRQAEAGQLGS